MSGFAGWVRARWQDFVRAIRLAPVRLGLLGTVLLVVGSLSPAYLPQASPYWPVMRALGLDTAWARVMATVLVMVCMCLGFNRRGGRRVLL